jgi:hypothetical protein
MKKQPTTASLPAPPPPAWFAFTGLSSAMIAVTLLLRVAEFFQSIEVVYLIAVPWLVLLALAGWLGSRRIPLGLGVLDQAVWSACLVYYLPQVFMLSAGWSAAARLGVTVLALMPVGYFLALPQAKGIASLRDGGFPSDSSRIAWLLHGAGWAGGAALAYLSGPWFGLDAIQLLGALFLAASLLAVRKKPSLPA